VLEHASGLRARHVDNMKIGRFYDHNLKRTEDREHSLGNYSIFPPFLYETLSTIGISSPFASFFS